MSDEFHPIKVKSAWPFNRERWLGDRLIQVPYLNIFMSSNTELTSWRKSDAIALSATQERVTFPVVLVHHEMIVRSHDPLTGCRGISENVQVVHNVGVRPLCKAGLRDVQR